MNEQTKRWHEVWECPRCGMQFAVGDFAVLSDPPKCSSYGHELVEMEQKMAQAFPFTVEEAFGA